MTAASRPPPRPLPKFVSRGCLFVAGGLAVAGVVFIGASVYLLLTAEPRDEPGAAVFFRACTPAEESHLRTVQQALVDNNTTLGQFDEISAIAGRSRLDLNMELAKPYPMRLSCVTSEECVHGIVPPGSIGLQSAIEIDVCDYKTADADFCDTFAALAFGHATARRVVPDRAERYHAFIRTACETIPR